VRRWWKLDGRRTYPAAQRLPIYADAGGSSGNRLRAWKLNLQQMADQIRIPITVCHYPPGTSKWNKIEYRAIFVRQSELEGTKARTGLKVKAVLDKNEYETGIKVCDEELEEIQLRRRKLHPA
jgi:Rhodopirellula transposase DDE domain